jgi:formylglycine-generating enzyme
MFVPLIMNYSNRARGFLLASLLTLLSVPAHADIGCQFVTVGNPGNTADTTGYGRVDYYYRIGVFEVTIAQYTAFLNAVAATDTYGLYTPAMATDLNVAGISRTGSPGSYTYAVIGDGNRPITYVCWFDAARMANWMHNGQPVGAQDASTTESGAYVLAGATNGIINKNSGALYYIPTEDEWFKAAYHDPSLNGGAGGYWLYPTRANSTPGNVVGPALDQVNYYTANTAPNGILSVTQTSLYSTTQNYLTPGGAFTNSGSAYGTFDQAGNVYEFNDAVIGANRGVRGGTWWANNSGATLQLSKNGRSPAVPTAENSVYGFRLAASAAPRIAVEQPAGSNLTNGAATLNFGALPMGASSSRIFTIRNTGTSPLTGLSLTADGGNSGDFIIGSPGSPTLMPGAATNFTVTCAPTGTVSRACGLYLHLASNDTNSTPFNIALAGDAFSPTADADGDGLNDWAEYQLAPLGFNWQVSQPSLVGALSNGANAAGLYSLSQIQSLNINTPLLSRDAGGNVKLTIGLQKATNLGSEFGPLPFHLPQMTVNLEGQLEFIFSPADNAAFFRLESH